MLVIVSLLGLHFPLFFFSFFVGPGDAVGGRKVVMGSSLPCG